MTQRMKDTLCWTREEERVLGGQLVNPPDTDENFSARVAALKRWTAKWDFPKLHVICGEFRGQEGNKGERKGEKIITTKNVWKSYRKTLSYEHTLTVQWIYVYLYMYTHKHTWVMVYTVRVLPHPKEPCTIYHKIQWQGWETSPQVLSQGDMRDSHDRMEYSLCL